MPGPLARALETLRKEPRTWLVTGAAGFIGSHLLEALLLAGQKVVGVDNLATGAESNFAAVQRSVGERWRDFRFVRGDITDLEICRLASASVDFVLHEAALGSVPRSIADPVATNQANVTGFINVCIAARDARVRRLIYASSSAVYGDDPTLPRVESRLGRPLSPYAVTKVANELYAAAFEHAYGLNSVGLRYFNVFGPRQSPTGPYAAVIPRWIEAQLHGQPCEIFGDGTNTRDFCFVANVVQANFLAATCPTGAVGEVFNVAAGSRRSLRELHEMLRDAMQHCAPNSPVSPVYSPARSGDVAHSEADISKARDHLGYEPTYDLRAGLEATVQWFCEQSTPAS